MYFTIIITAVRKTAVKINISISKSEISFIVVSYVKDMFFCNGADFFVGDFFEFLFNEFLTDIPCIIACIINKIFFKRHKGVGVATVLNLTALAKRHKAVARSAFSVTGGAE